MQNCNLITLTTDFGLKDPFVGQMKGAILKHNFDARIIDITHAVPAHDILTAAVIIRTSYNYFPKGSTHVVVVDPGVGSQRQILAAVADGHMFIVPDNGTLTILAKDSIIEHVHRVENKTLFPRKISSTFHGRDIMAPVAAALAKGMPINELGPPTDMGQCVLLNIGNPQISAKANIEIGDQRIITIDATYSQQETGKLLALIDSAGYLEIAVNKSSAAQLTCCELGDPVIVHMS